VATVAVENYLKHVLLLAQGDELVSMGDLAGALAVVPGTATTMVKALADEGLVEHQPRQGVRLTAEGRRVALNVLRKHRLVETFLDALLGHPQTDPHGDPIPSRQGKLNAQVYATLATCVPERPMRIVRITDQSADFLQFAEQQGLQPGTALRVTDRNLNAGLVSLRKPAGRAIALSLAAAGKISVAPER
jgi:DtxR family Mn-dependent transcriptional regulator